MSTTDTQVKNLIINRLSNEQYATAVKSDTELYLTPELPASTTELGPVKVDGTTITATSDGTISATSQLPSQTSQSGKFLTTDGTSASWASVPASLPSQSGQSGKYLTTDGTDASWATVDALPSQSGKSGKFLTTNGTTTSWADTPTEIEYATYGSTSYAQISTWYDAGKTVILTNGNRRYRLMRKQDDKFFFGCYVNKDELAYIELSYTNNTNYWTVSGQTIQTRIPAGTAGEVVTYTGTAGTIGSAALPTTMTGATSSVAGTSGLVPAPAIGDNDKYLKGDGTWATMGTYKPPILSYQWADHKLTDLSWLRADTFSWQSGDVYEAAYTELSTEYASAQSVTTTIDHDEPWTQPVLTEYGTMGGDTCAVSTTVDQHNSNLAWHAFSPDFTGGAGFHSTINNTTGSFTYYSPTPIKITAITFTNQTDSGSGNRASASGTIYVSNDNENWITLKTYTNSQQNIGATWSIDLLDNTGYYKYYKLYSNGSNTNYWTFKTCAFTAYTYEIDIQYKTTPKGYKITTPTYISYVENLYRTTKAAWYYVLDTTNTRFKLPRCKHGHGALLKSGTNNYGWYRIYQDGWCEQGGISGLIVDYGTSTINFEYPYLTTDYTITMGTALPGTTDDGQWMNNVAITYTSKTRNSFNLYNRGSSDGGRYTHWETRGYIATADTSVDVQYSYLYFYMGEFTQAATEQTAGLNSELFNGKVDIESLMEVTCIVDSYYDNTTKSWYRVYSDGWCEQGGLTSVMSNTQCNATLVRPFANTDYFVTVMAQARAGWLGILSKTTTAFTCRIEDGGGQQSMYYACGYIV